jgi:regulator of protease activity HflC (stomatin/prohibitin superfamily)
MNTGVLPHELAGSMADGGKALIATISGGAIAVGMAIKLFTNVSENERAIVLHRSKATRPRTKNDSKQEGDMYGTVGPGWHMQIPGVRSFKKVSLKERNSRLQDIHPVVHGQKTLFASHVNWSIFDETYAMHAATYGMENEAELDQTVVSICNSGLRRVLNGLPKAYLTDEDVLFAGVQAITFSKLMDHGVMLRSMQLVESNPTDAQIQSNAIREGIHDALSTIALGGQMKIPEQMIGPHSVPDIA